MKKYIFGLTVLALVLFPLGNIKAENLSVSTDTLIKGGMSTLYYYAADGNRYVFPNDKTFGSWFSNFEGVKTITDEELAKIPLKGNVTYRPGVRMVKIQTVPKVYAVDEGGQLRWIETEEMAKKLYGDDWNKKIDDIPDAFFVNYKEGASIKKTDDYSPTTAAEETRTINKDRGIIENASTPKATTSVGSSTIPATPAEPNKGSGPATPAIPAQPGNKATSTPSDSATSTPSGTTPATPATPAVPGNGTTSTIPAVPAIPATPTTPTTSTPPTSETPTSTPPADTTAPVISNVSASISQTTTTITWTTNEAATSQIEYGLTSSYGNTTSLDSVLATSHSVQIANLSTNTAYHYRVKSTDAAGNTATSEDKTFVVLPQFILSWGSEGTNNGQFLGSPYAVDTDSQGNVYVSDDYRVHKFNSQGVFITSSNRGTGGPGLAIDSQDNIYVVNHSIYNTVKKFDSNLNLLATIFSELYTATTTYAFKDVAIDSSDNLFIAANHEMFKMDTNGNVIKKWGSKCGGDGAQSEEVIGSDSQGNICFAGQLVDAQAIGVDLNNNVYAIEYWLHHVQVFDNNGNYIKTWGTSGSGDGYFRTPFGGAFDSQNNIYIADYYNNRVQKLTSNGVFILKWGSSYGNPGSGQGEFYAPGDVAISNDGSIYVVEQGNYRIQKFGY